MTAAAHCGRPLPEPYVQVSGSDEITSLAAKISWNIRREEHMPMLASGASAIKVAVDVRCPLRRPATLRSCSHPGWRMTLHFSALY